MPPIVSIVGRSESGKTTLIEKLIPMLTRHSYRIGTIKHTHHAVETDRFGKDSARHRSAGAQTVMLAASGQITMFKATSTESLDALSRYFDDVDLLITMPLHYEPCGLGQLIALRYGTVPVVRKTGGLADTVFDARDGAKEPTGFTFTDYTVEALWEAITRALQTFHDKPVWKRIVRWGMNSDFSWQRAAERYAEPLSPCGGKEEGLRDGYGEERTG